MESYATREHIVLKSHKIGPKSIKSCILSSKPYHEALLFNREHWIDPQTIKSVNFCNTIVHQNLLKLSFSTKTHFSSGKPHWKRCNFFTETNLFHSTQTKQDEYEREPSILKFHKRFGLKVSNLHSELNFM